MSTATGTATSYLDLLSKLRTFLTTDATLVAAGQNWTELATNSTPYQQGVNNGVTTQDTVDFETYLKAPGLTGTEAIYINIRAFHYVAGDYWNFEMRGAQGYNAGQSFIAQPGISPPTFIYLWNQPITYWFIANGQRVIIIAKVSTVYESAYLGKFLPYGTPGQYPYPVAIGGCGATTNGDLRYSDSTFSHVAFFDPAGLMICDPANAWQTFQNLNAAGPISPANEVWPYLYSSTNRPNWMSPNLDGTFTILPCRMQQNTPSLNLLGELDGVGYVTGNSNASENTINDGTNTWMVVQNTFRTQFDNYCAVKMV